MKQVEERYISLLTDKVFDRLFEEAEIAKFTPQEMREYETSKMAYRDIKNVDYEYHHIIKGLYATFSSWHIDHSTFNNL